MTRTVKILAACALFVAAGLALAGCATGRSLEGTSWRLVGWSVSSIDPAQVTITAQFSDGNIGGSGGVNSYGGPYTAGPGDTFRAGPITSTLIAGPEPAMSAESAYFALLDKAGSYEVEGETLTLFDTDGNESLIFEKAE